MARKTKKKATKKSKKNFFVFTHDGTQALTWGQPIAEKEIKRDIKDFLAQGYHPTEIKVAEIIDVNIEQTIDITFNH